MCSLRAVGRLEGELLEVWWPQPSRTLSIWGTNTNLTVNFTEQPKLLLKQHNPERHESLTTDRRLNVQKSLIRRIMWNQSQLHPIRTNYGVMPQVQPVQEYYRHWLYQWCCCTRGDCIVRTDCDVILVLLVLSQDSHITFLWWNTHTWLKHDKSGTHPDDLGIVP